MKSGLSVGKFLLIFTVIGLLFPGLTACQAVGPTRSTADSTLTPSEGIPVPLTPYRTPTASQTPLSPDPITSTPFPTPTSTPRSHVVQAGEDMFGIAYQYGITLQELQAANPDVNPNFLSVDMVLLIPASTLAKQTPGTLPSPTPAGAYPGIPNCYRTGEGGLWCFIPITNQSQGYIEAVSLQVRLTSEGVQVAVGSALTVLNLIPPGTTIPAAVYFPPPIPNSYEVNAQLETSLPVQNLSERYISVRVDNLATEIASDSKSAGVQGEIVMDEADSPSQIAMAAVAYNSEGNIIGFRRWENDQPSFPLSFSFQVYSLAGAIEQVSVFAEAAR